MPANKNWFAPLIRKDYDKYPHGFDSWMRTDEGAAVWDTFELHALKIARLRKRYSAHAIAQVIRWNTTIRGGDDFKVNNNWIPGLARLWMQRYGERYPGFFQIRDSLGW